MRNKLGASSVLTIVANFGAIGLGLLTAVLLSRLLGPTGRGEIAAALLWPQTFVYLVSIGVQEASLYLAAKDDADTGSILTNALGLSVVQSLVIIPLGYLLLPLLLTEQRAEVVMASRVFLLMIPFSLFSLNLLNVLRARMRIDLYNIGRLVIPVGYFVGVSLLALTDQLTVEAVVLIQLILNIVLFLLALTATLRTKLLYRSKMSHAISRNLLHFGVRVQIGSISQLANLRFDQMLIAAFLPPDQLGLYVVAVSAAHVVHAVPSAFRTVITPFVAQMDSKQTFSPSLAGKMRKALLITIVAGLGALVAVPFLLPLVFGAEFAAATPVAEVLIVATIFLGGKEVLTALCYGLGSPGLSSRAEIAALIVTVGGLPLLLPRLGIMGAGLTTLMAYLASFLVIVYGLQRQHQIPPRSLLLIRRDDIAELISQTRRLRFSRAAREH